MKKKFERPQSHFKMMIARMASDLIIIIIIIMRKLAKTCNYAEMPTIYNHLGKFSNQ